MEMILNSPLSRASLTLCMMYRLNSIYVTMLKLVSKYLFLSGLAVNGSRVDMDHNLSARAHFID